MANTNVLYLSFSLIFIYFLLLIWWRIGALLRSKPNIYPTSKSKGMNKTSKNGRRVLIFDINYLYLYDFTKFGVESKCEIENKRVLTIKTTNK